MKLSSLLIVFSAVVCSVSAARFSVAAVGTLLCQIDNNYYPLKEITVKLLDSDAIIDDMFGETRSSLDGTFYVSGTAADLFGTPDPFIKVEYQYTGRYGQMEVNGLLHTLRDYSTPKRKYRQFINFQDIVIRDDHCRAYVKFYEAMGDYYNRTGQSLPFMTLHIRTHAILQLGTPYAERRTINIPERYPVTTMVAKLQLGHIIRHFLDGNMAHLISDALRFRYEGPHSCSTPTNEGLAFDEGWAEFWAGGCYSIRGYGNSQFNYTYEGNVASALRRLKMRCRFTDRDMIDVLRRNPGTIHSFGEYQSASGCNDFPTSSSGGGAPPTEWMPRPTSRPRRRWHGVTGYVKNQQVKSQEEGQVKEMNTLLERILKKLLLSK